MIGLMRRLRCSWARQPWLKIEPLRPVDVRSEVSRKLGVAEQTYYRWRKEYGGMRVDQARRLQELERENNRLKRLVADITLDNAILKEATRGNS